MAIHKTEDARSKRFAFCGRVHNDLENQFVRRAEQNIRVYHSLLHSLHHSLALPLAEDVKVLGATDPFLIQTHFALVPMIASICANGMSCLSRLSLSLSLWRRQQPQMTRSRGEWLRSRSLRLCVLSPAKLQGNNSTTQQDLVTHKQLGTFRTPLRVFPRTSLFLIRGFAPLLWLGKKLTTAHK